MDQGPIELIMREWQEKPSLCTQEILVWSPSSLRLFSSLKPLNFCQLLVEENTDTSTDVGKV